MATRPRRAPAGRWSALAAAGLAIAASVALAPATLASFSAPVRVGFAGGDEPATADDDYGQQRG